MSVGKPANKFVICDFVIERSLQGENVYNRVNKAKSDQGKPGESRGRKATGLKLKTAMTAGPPKIFQIPCFFGEPGDHPGSIVIKSTKFIDL